MTRLNLDLAGTWTDATLDEIVDHLDSVYRQAYREMKEERDKSFSLFVKADKDKQKQLENGTITEEYYKQWRLGWIRNNEKMQSLMDDYAKKATETNKIASDYINGITPEVFMYNHNFTAYEFEKGTGVSFSIVDNNTVKELATNKNHSEFRTISINPKRDYAWNRKQIQRTLTAGIIQGKSIPKIAKDFYKVMGNNKSVSVRNARTAVTSAQNGGRQKGFEQAHDLGIKFKKEWLSAHDGRVRDSHAHLDGVRVEYDEKFPNGLMYPGDPQGHPGEVYNCRCTLIADVNGMRGQRTSNSVQSYNLWCAKKNAEKLIEEAKYRDSFVTNILKKAVSKGTGHLEGLDYRIKSFDSLQRKLQSKAMQKNITVSDYSEKVTGVLRYTNVSDANNLYSDYEIIVKNLAELNYNMIEVTNTFESFGAYKGINTLVEDNTGYVFELQFHTPESLEIKEVNHKLYEEQRLDSTPMERKIELDKEMRKNADSVPIPKNIGVIKDK